MSEEEIFKIGERVYSVLTGKIGIVQEVNTIEDTIRYEVIWLGRGVQGPIRSWVSDYEVRRAGNDD